MLQINLHIPKILRTFLISASLRTICSKGDCAFREGTALLEFLLKCQINLAIPKILRTFAIAKI